MLGAILKGILHVVGDVVRIRIGLGWIKLCSSIFVIFILDIPRWYINYKIFISYHGHKYDNEKENWLDINQ